MRCPECDAPLTPAGLAYACARCTGTFVPRAERDAVIAAATRDAADAPPPPAADLPGPVVYRRCPGCGSRMNRKQFGLVSGVVLDECVDGTWFSAGALRRVGAFLANGGAARMERAAAERAAEDAKYAAERAARREARRAAQASGVAALPGGGFFPGE